MSQVDIAFVRRDGFLRKHHFYATTEQRQTHNALARMVRDAREDDSVRTGST